MASRFASLRGVFVGSGSDGLNEPGVRDAVMKLIVRKESPKRVLYLGTATYDLTGPRERQTGLFAQAGCQVTSLDVACSEPSHGEMKAAVDQADVVIVSGGNTLFAVDRWKKLGLDVLLQEAMVRGAVLAGGSAGAICWFDGGHSDSADPDSFKKSMLSAAPHDGDESTIGGAPGDTPKQWNYIRVDGLGFLPGLVCPHHDKIQSNGVLRAIDFDKMMLRHPGETGVCIDHWAALVVEGERYEVLSLEGKEGSVGTAGEFLPERTGAAGIWIKRVIEGKLQATLCPPSGKLEDILMFASEIVEDPAVETIRKQNPAF